MAKKMISLEITSELREALRIEAFNRAITVSALIRQLLEDSLPIKNNLKQIQKKEKESKGKLNDR